MSESFVVTVDRKSYTWDDGRWYGTLDHVKPTLGLIHRLNALMSQSLQADAEKRQAKRTRRIKPVTEKPE
jgi:hypothetical protein